MYKLITIISYYILCTLYNFEGYSTPNGTGKKHLPSPTVLSRAKLIIFQNRIPLVPRQKSFAVALHMVDMRKLCFMVKMGYKDNIASAYQQ
jgi:hypothetical protein